jgi:hypothetical protein
MHTQSIKRDAFETLQCMPDTAYIEEIMYRLYVLEIIRRGQSGAEQGNSTDAKQLLKDIQTWCSGQTTPAPSSATH